MQRDSERGARGSSLLTAGPSIGLFVAAMVSIIALVWLILWLGNSDTSRNPGGEEEVIFSGFVTLLPDSASWLGIDVLLSRDALFPEGPHTDGVMVSHVMVGSPAFNAGLRDGDVIVRVAGKRIRQPYQLSKIIAGQREGSTISVVVERFGRQRKLHVTLSRRPMARLAAARAPGTEGWLGVDLQRIEPMTVKQLGLPDQRGVIVAHVHPGSPAASAGITQGAVIRRVNGTRLRDMEQLRTLMGSHEVGDSVRLGVLQKGTQSNVKMRLARRPDPGKVPQPPLPEAEVEIEAAWLGLDIVPLTRVEAEELGLPEGLRGMVVDDVAAGTGVDAGFLAGDVITGINGKPAATVGEFKEATENDIGALVDIVRAGRHIYIAVPPPGGAAAAKSKPAVRQVGFGTPRSTRSRVWR